MLENGLVPGTYRAMSKSRTIIDILKTELDKKVLKLSRMLSEVRDVEIKNIVRFQPILSRYFFVLLFGEGLKRLIKNLKLCSGGLLESGALIEMEGSVERLRYSA